MSPQQEKELTQLVTASWLGGIDHLEVIQVYQKLDERTLKQTHLEFFS